MKKMLELTIDDAIQIVEKALNCLNDLKSGSKNVKSTQIAHKRLCMLNNENTYKNEKEVTICYGFNSCIHIEHSISEKDENSEQEGGAV